MLPLNRSPSKTFSVSRIKNLDSDVPSIPLSSFCTPRFLSGTSTTLGTKEKVRPKVVLTESREVSPYPGDGTQNPMYLVCSREPFEPKGVLTSLPTDTSVYVESRGGPTPGSVGRGRM